MRPLTLHVSALSDDEESHFKDILRHISKLDRLPPQEYPWPIDTNFDKVKVTINNTRAWMCGFKFPRIPLADINSILILFHPNPSATDHYLTGGQVFAALRIMNHAIHGQPVDRKFAFYQPGTRPETQIPLYAGYRADLSPENMAHRLAPGSRPVTNHVRRPGLRSARKKVPEVGDVVLGTTPGWTEWPGRILDPKDLLGKWWPVEYFPTAEISWLPPSAIEELTKPKIRAFLGSPEKKKELLRYAYEIALDPEEWIRAGDLEDSQEE